MRRGSLAVVAVLSVAPVAACGVTHDKTARAIVPIPAALVDTTTTSTTTPPPTEPSTAPTTAPASTTTVPTEVVSLYYQAGDRLRAQGRFVPLAAGGARLDVPGTVRELELGPQNDPTLQNLVTPGLWTVTADRGRAVVVVTPVFQALAPPLQLVAVAQLVLTLTDRPGVGHVVFVDGTGAPVPVPRADGSTGDDVSAEDYLALRA